MNTLKFNKELYSKTALIKAAYNFSDRAYIHLDADESSFYVYIEAKSGENAISENEFINEMLAQSVRHEIYQQTKNIRELLVARAMATSLIVDNEVIDEEVTEEDHHQIAHEMDEWIDKIKTHLSYMSDVITAVKGQAVTFSDNSKNSFTAKDLVKHVDILMRHELKHSIVNLNTFVKVDDSIEFTGNINSLVQVVNNIISNAIQAYNGKPNENIDLHLYQENNKLVIKIQDYAGGLPDKVKDKLFKEMITTKGKNGTGLGLFMSYSNIKAHFNGNMRYETTKGEGTSFYIEIPE